MFGGLFKTKSELNQGWTSSEQRLDCPRYAAITKGHPIANNLPALPRRQGLILQKGS